MQTFDFIAEFAARAQALGIEMLVEVHSYYQRQIGREQGTPAWGNRRRALIDALRVLPSNVAATMPTAD